MDGVLLRSCAQLPPVRQAASTEDVIILANATAILVTVAQPVLLKPLQVESIHAAFLTLPRLAIWLMASYYMTALLDIRELPQKHALTFLASTAISVARPAVTAGLELTAQPPFVLVRAVAMVIAPRLTHVPAMLDGQGSLARKQSA